MRSARRIRKLVDGLAPAERCEVCGKPRPPRAPRVARVLLPLKDGVSPDAPRPCPGCTGILVLARDDPRWETYRAGRGRTDERKR
jgi:hypothetical protein